MAKEDKKIHKLSDEEVGSIAKDLLKHEARETISRKIGDLGQKLNIPKEKLGYVAYIVLKELIAEYEARLV